MNYGGRSYSTRAYSYGGTSYHAVYMGGYGDYWYHPAWYYYMPFHPAFYYGGPQYMNDGGYYAPGGFSFFRALIGLFFFGVIAAVVIAIFRGRGSGGGGGGGRRLRYTSY